MDGMARLIGAATTMAPRFSLLPPTGCAATWMPLQFVIQKRCAIPPPERRATERCHSLLLSAPFHSLLCLRTFNAYRNAASSLPPAALACVNATARGKQRAVGGGRDACATYAALAYLPVRTCCRARTCRYTAHSLCAAPLI